MWHLGQSSAQDLNNSGRTVLPQVALFMLYHFSKQNDKIQGCVLTRCHTKKEREREKKEKAVKVLKCIFRRFLHLLLDVPWHALFTFGIGKKDFQIIQLKSSPSRDPVPFLSSAYWAAPTVKKHLTALTVNEANFVLFIKTPFWRW